MTTPQARNGEIDLDIRSTATAISMLTRGFMYAGASRVVASLWKVNDEATAEQMRYFYRAMLGQGMTPAAALRSAQLALRQKLRWNSRYFWAAFQIQGEWK